MTTMTVLAKLRSGLHDLRADQAGNVAVIFTLALLPIMSSVGAAVDYSHANSIKTAMQGAVDATALMMVKTAGTLSDTVLTQQANDKFKALFNRPETVGVQISAQYDAQSRMVTVSSTGSMKTDFLRVMGFSSVDISARAVAVSVGDGLGCVLALNKTASGAITAQGSTTINLNGCSIFDNSNSATAMTVGGSAKVSALSVGVVGGITGGAGITTTQGIATGILLNDDPYAKVSVPFFSGCDKHNFSSHVTETINPGVYCGGMKLNAGAVVTLNPGIYFLDQGDLSVSASATLKGTGVTLIFTSSTMTNWATATISGGATINLTPPSTGPTAGLVMFGDRNIPVGTSFKFNGGASQYLGGAIYFPTGAVTYAGGAGTNTSCTQIIGDTVIFTGNSDLAINCSGYGTKAFGPAGVRLVS
jgi:Flp pilus assembly protein TadG